MQIGERLDIDFNLKEIEEWQKDYPKYVKCEPCNIMIEIEEGFNNGLNAYENKNYYMICHLCNRKILYYTIKE